MAMGFFKRLGEWADNVKREPEECRRVGLPSRYWEFAEEVKVGRGEREARDCRDRKLACVEHRDAWAEAERRARKEGAAGWLVRATLKYGGKKLEYYWNGELFVRTKRFAQPHETREDGVAVANELHRRTGHVMDIYPETVAWVIRRSGGNAPAWWGGKEWVSDPSMAESLLDLNEAWERKESMARTCGGETIEQESLWEALGKEMPLWVLSRKGQN